MLFDADFRYQKSANENGGYRQKRGAPKESFGSVIAITIGRTKKEIDTCGKESKGSKQV